MSETKECPICGKKIKWHTATYKLKDGLICYDCADKVDLAIVTMDDELYAKLLTVQDVREAIKTDKKFDVKLIKAKVKEIRNAEKQVEQKEKQAKKAKEQELKQVQQEEKQKQKEIKKKQKEEQKQIEREKKQAKRQAEDERLQEIKNDGAINFGIAYFDDKQQVLLFKRTMLYKQEEYSYSDITGFKPNIEGKDVKKHHGVGRALVGGILAGGVGAVVGATTGGKQYSEVTRVSGFVYFKDNSSEEIVLIHKTVETNTRTYREAKNRLNHLEEVVNNAMRLANEAKIETESAKSDSFDDIRKLKGLLDDGIITQEEFDTKKKQLLGL